MAKQKEVDKGRAPTARAMLYSFFAQALSAPREAFVSALADGSLRKTVEAALSAAPIAHRKYDWSALEALSDAGSDQLDEDYTRIFGVSVSCPPYEADYLSNDPFRSVHVIADVTGFYSTFGVEVAGDAGERADFIAVELQFMSFLCSKQARAAVRDRKGRAKRSREAQAKFFKAHVGAWAKEFAEKLIEVSGGGFYQAIGRLLVSFTDAEASYLERSAPVAEETRPGLKIIG